MGRSWLLALGMVIAGPAWADPLVVWMQDSLPEDGDIARADHKTGGTQHVTILEVAFPPEPLTQEDAQHLTDVREAYENAQSRWNEFEVELLIAQDLQMTLDSVDVLSDERDLGVVIEALLLQGAAVLRAFDAEDFGRNERSAPWRMMIGQTAVPRAWVDAWALAGAAGRGSLTRNEFIDTAAWADWQRLHGVIEGQDDGSLGWNPAIGRLWVDGAPVDGNPGVVSLRPGLHRVHVERGGVVCGRERVVVSPGATATVRGRISEEDVSAARARVGLGTTTGLPDSVADGLVAVRAREGGPIFLGSVDDGQLEVVGWDGAGGVEKQVFTAVLTAEIGGGISMSKLYDQAEGSDARLAGAFSGGFGVELGLSYFLFQLGMDATVTPGSTMRFANDAGTDNAHSAVSPQPHGGIGVYFLRPIADTPTLSLAADVMWSGPAHLSYGGRLAIGVPIDARKNWFRVVLGGSYGPATLWDLPEDPVSLTQGWLRIGLGSRL